MADDPKTDSTPAAEAGPPKPKGQFVPVISPHVMYCSSVILQISKEEAVLSFISGGAVANEFAFSLPHLKRLQEALTKNIELFEKENDTKIPNNRTDVEDVKVDSPSA